jgi:16S rRNA (guanine527-N7)-methyltransferase
MPFPLPHLSLQSFAAELAPLSPEPLSQAAMNSLYAYYQELARWNEKLNLIGPGTAGEILARHFGESLASLPLLPPGARVGLDLGSGAGFPGLVIAAARPEMEMTLVEARERKWAFLLTAARRASLSCRSLNARVRIPLPSGLPESLDVITSRALRLDPETWGALARRLGAGGRILLWVGENDPELPPDFVACGGVKLAGSERRRILVLRAAAV